MHYKNTNLLVRKIAFQFKLYTYKSGKNEYLFIIF